MKNITTNELKTLLSNQKHATPITIVALVNARALKTGNPYDMIMKCSVVNGFTGFDYESSVNRQLVREDKDPQFQAQSRAWGTNINNVLVEKDGKFYLTIRPTRCSKPTYFGKRGNSIIKVSKQSIEKWLPKSYKAENQGTEKEIVYRNYSLESLRNININGQKYAIVG